jgi:predicted glycosyltransferase
MSMKRSHNSRIAVFTHDTYGLGHGQRCLNIMNAVAQKAADVAILIVTACPAFHLVGALPRNADIVKIPTLARTGEPDSRPPHLPLSDSEVLDLRKRITYEAIIGFEPNVLLVDSWPLGTDQELLSTLDQLSNRSTRLVLGLRDIVDDPAKVRAEWVRSDVYRGLEEYYDRILIYGMRNLFDPETVYGLSSIIAQKIQYCGFVTAEPATREREDNARNELGVEGRLVLATVGGGGDGFQMLECFIKCLDDLEDLEDVTGLVITGPVMGAPERTCLKALADTRANIILRKYVTDLPGYLAAADVVVSMGGYNTTLEILRSGTQGIIVPRAWQNTEQTNSPRVGHEWEQLIRARIFQEMGLIDMVETTDLTPKTLASRIRSAMLRPRMSTLSSLDFGGADVASDTLLELANARRSPAHASA